MARLLGDRSRSTDLWMDPEDESAFDAQLHETFPHAAWQCSHPGPLNPELLHLHPSLSDALQCGGTQAFMPLPVGACHHRFRPLAGVTVSGETQAAIVQFLRSSRLPPHLGSWYRSGWLAVKWNTGEVGEELHERMNAEAKQVWSALTRTTRSVALSSPNGHITKGQRFGPSALSAALDPGALLALNNVRGMTVVVKS